MNRVVEILAPAGSMECLQAAIAAGADAVYLGGTRFGARAYAQNLSEEDMVQAIEYVHIHRRKIYMTVNTLLKDREMEELYAYLLPYYRAGLDGVIVQDIGVVKYIREHFPEMPVHASTQMTITNTLGADHLKQYGITRVVPARELSLGEIRDMKRQTGLEMECFVHGALCYCYSGQCLLSSMIGGRSGNRGQCAQPCRLLYRTPEAKRPQYLLSLKDICTLELIPEMIESGIYSFKIEGKEKHVKNTETTVKDGCLLIGFKDRKNKSMRNQKDGVTIWISAPDLKKVEFTGVGEFNCEKPLKLDEVSFEVKGVGEVNVSDLTCDELKVTLRGVGSADIHVVCDYLTARMSGVGDVTLSGTAGHADISKGGIGGVNTCNLKVGR